MIRSNQEITMFHSVSDVTNVTKLLGVNSIQLGLSIPAEESLPASWMSQLNETAEWASWMSQLNEPAEGNQPNDPHWLKPEEIKLIAVADRIMFLCLVEILLKSHWDLFEMMWRYVQILRTNLHLFPASLRLN